MSYLLFSLNHFSENTFQFCPKYDILTLELHIRIFHSTEKRKDFCYDTKSLPPIPPPPVATPMCRWHHNTNIVARCPICGSFTCEQCSLPTPDGRHLCPNCFKSEYGVLISRLNHEKTTAIICFLLGVLLAVSGYMISLIPLMEKYHLTLSDLNPGVIFSGLVVYCNDSVVLAVLLLFLGLLPCIATIGFFFGIRRVFRFLRHVPVFVIVFSIIFFVITLGLIFRLHI